MPNTPPTHDRLSLRKAPTAVSMASSARPQAGSSLREFELIRALKQRYSATDARIVLGMGDDAAVIAPRRGDRWLLTTDLLAEGIHFDRATAAFADIGFRAAAANLSDIAAMGGSPDFLLVSLAIPRDGTVRQVKHLYSGMMAACRPYRVKLIGGDTSASTGGWFVGITLVGSAGSGRILLRSGAQAGDDLYVTGTLGDSRAGLGLMQRPKGPGRSLDASQRRFLLQRHLRPLARNQRLGDVRHRCLGRPFGRPAAYMRRKPRGRARRTVSAADFPRLSGVCLVREAGRHRPRARRW